MATGPHSSRQGRSPDAGKSVGEGLQGRQWWTEQCRGKANQGQEGISGSAATVILSSLPGSIHLLRSTQICACCTAGTGLNRPSRAARTYGLGAREQGSKWPRQETPFLGQDSPVSCNMQAQLNHPWGCPCSLASLSYVPVFK